MCLVVGMDGIIKSNYPKYIETSTLGLVKRVINFWDIRCSGVEMLSRALIGHIHNNSGCRHHILYFKALSQISPSPINCPTFITHHP